MDRPDSLLVVGAAVITLKNHRAVAESAHIGAVGSKFSLLNHDRTSVDVAVERYSSPVGAARKMFPLARHIIVKRIRAAARNPPFGGPTGIGGLCFVNLPYHAGSLWLSCALLQHWKDFRAVCCRTVGQYGALVHPNIVWTV